MTIREKRQQLFNQATEAKTLYELGKIDETVARERINPYIEEHNYLVRCLSKGDEKKLISFEIFCE